MRRINEVTLILKAKYTLIHTVVVHNYLLQAFLKYFRLRKKPSNTNMR